MPTTTEIQQVVDIFCSLLNQRETRLANGARLRKEMHETLEAGERPTGYRPDWVRISALRMVHELQKLGLEFNDEHKNDQCSLGDLMDVLTTAMNHLKKRREEE